jgi:colanic acid biosynthesis glycosyl transferase WcaI
MLARSLQELDHDVTVVAAHPLRLRPYRERRDGIEVLRLPLWAGRGSALARVRQELSFTAAQSLVAPLLPSADVMVAVTPSFPALGPAIVNAAVRRIPWVMWLQDIVTDGAATTGELSEGPLLRAARNFELFTYNSAARVVVISEAFRENLLAKGVPSEKIERVFNPSSRPAEEPNDIAKLVAAPPKILAMGNIGHTQGLEHIVDAFEANERLKEQGVELVIAGSGVAADEVRERIRTDRVHMPGVLYGDELTPELRSASIGLVSQRAGISEFNLPSKLMNYMAFGIPVVASVNPDSEAARVVRESGAGWVTDAAYPERFAEQVATVIRDEAALLKASQAGYAFAAREFAPASVAKRFEHILESAVRPSQPDPSSNGSA